MIRFAGTDGFKRQLPSIALFGFHSNGYLDLARRAALAAKVTGRVMEVVEPEVIRESVTEKTQVTVTDLRDGYYRVAMVNFDLPNKGLRFFTTTTEAAALQKADDLIACYK